MVTTLQAVCNSQMFLRVFAELLPMLQLLISHIYYRQCCYVHYECHSIHTTTTTTILRPFVRDYPGEPVPEETFTHPPSWSSSSLYQLLPSTKIHSILLVQITCLAIFLHNFSSCPLWSTSWSGAIHLILHTFLHPIGVFFLQHMPIPSQPVLLYILCTVYSAKMLMMI